MKRRKFKYYEQYFKELYKDKKIFKEADGRENFFDFLEKTHEICEDGNVSRKRKFIIYELFIDFYIPIYLKIENANKHYTYDSDNVETKSLNLMSENLYTFIAKNISVDEAEKYSIYGGYQTKIIETIEYLVKEMPGKNINFKSYRLYKFKEFFKKCSDYLFAFYRISPVCVLVCLTVIILALIFKKDFIELVLQVISKRLIG